MATTPSYSQGAIDNLEQSQSDLENELSSSSSTYSSSLTTAPKDLQTEIRLRQVQSSLDKLQAKKINEQWYGAGKSSQADSTSGTNKNIIFKGLDALSRPLYAVSGAVKYATGDRSGSLFNTMNKNMTTDKSTFGDILGKAGAPKAVSAPIGFALDVAFDPINWLTMGTAALVPKIGYGLIKGAAGDAIKESALKTAATVGKYIPGVSKGFVEKAGAGAIKAGEKYNAKTGRNILDLIDKRAQRPTIGNYMSEAARNLPGGDWVVKNFSYSPEEWYRVAKIKDEVETAAQKRGGVLSSVFNKETGVMEAPEFGSIKSKLEQLPGGETGVLTDGPISRMSETVGKNISEKDKLLNKEAAIIKEGVELSDQYTNLARSKDSVENMQRLLGEANIEASHREIVKALNELAGVGTGPNKYDRMMTNLKGVKVGNKQIVKDLLDGYQSFIGIFKSAKIGFLSPASVTNAVIGNGAMLHLVGGDLTRSEYYRNIQKAWNFVRGKSSKNFFKEGLLDTPEWQDFIKTNPGIFKKTYGFSGDKALKVKELINEALSKAPELAGGNKYDRKEIQKVIDDIFSKGNKELSMGSPLKYSSGVSESERATDLASQELTGDAFMNLKNDLEDLASGKPTEIQLARLKEKGLSGEAFQKEYDKLVPSELKKKISKSLHWALTKPSESYSQIDQANKLGVAMTWVKDGVTEKELTRMTKSVIPGTRGAVSIEAKDILDKYPKNGKYYYRLTPDKATEIANLTFMNYAAMPAAVKVLRSIPVLGSPFFSFSYAMAAKMGQTLLSNPAAYNKVSFGIHEASGNKTPLEKKALQSSYYKFYNNPGMVKLPFFKDNPLYLNVANMIPYYGMNMFMPSERKYQDTLGSDIVAILDKTPILKDPVGQTIFDYFIQPLLIKDSMPQGSFGQALYPDGTSAIGKLGYAARNIAEAPLPSSAAALSLITPEKALDYVPSYRWRQLGYAMKGKNPLGAKATEPASSRTLRTLGGIAGLSTNPLDLTYAASNNKK